MEKVFRAIIASSPANNFQFDPRRTDILWSKDSVKELNFQVNKRKEEGTAIIILERTPKFKGDHPEIIGEIIKSELVQEENNCLQCVAELNIKEKGFKSSLLELKLKETYNTNLIKEILDNKQLYCFFPLVGYNNEHSVKKIYENEDDEVNYLYPPLKLLALHFGAKRTSSNPYLTIL